MPPTPHHDSLDVEVLPTADDLAARATEIIADAGATAVARDGRFILGLTGGDSPVPLYRLMAGTARDRFPWTHTTIIFGDDRCVPPDHEKSNYAMVMRELLSHVAVPADRVLRMEGELEPDDAAARYEAQLRDTLGERGMIDLLLLGVGPDGHTASLFPGADSLDETERLVLHTKAPPSSPIEDRLTLTLPAMARARVIVVLCPGEHRRPIVRAIIAGDPGADAYPAAHPRGAEQTIWLCDREAWGEDA